MSLLFGSSDYFNKLLLDCKISLIGWYIIFNRRKSLFVVVPTNIELIRVKRFYNHLFFVPSPLFSKEKTVGTESNKECYLPKSGGKGSMLTRASLPIECENRAGQSHAYILRRRLQPSLESTAQRVL